MVEPSNTTALAGSRVVMECAGAGFPPPLVTWSQVLTGELPAGAYVELSGSLIIEHVTPAHAGLYICRLAQRNQVVVTRREVVLKVQGKTRTKELPKCVAD